MFRLSLLLLSPSLMFLMAALLALSGCSGSSPAVPAIRYVFSRDADRVARELDSHQPAHVGAQINEQYEPNQPDALLDVFYPDNASATPAPLTIVWIHGGAWVSGDKKQLSGYARILAARGFTVAVVDYSLAPSVHFPVPVQQVNIALSYLESHASRLHVDPSRIVLAGDSAGAQIAAVLANAVVNPIYAAAIAVRPSISRQQLVGAILYCGVYDFEALASAHRYRYFLRAVLQAYSGTDSFSEDQTFAYASVVRYVSDEFPPTFISAGNADPLQEQSLAFARALTRHAIDTRQLFFASTHSPPLPHEYQFNLDTAAGRQALDHSVQFLESISIRRRAQPWQRNADKYSGER